MAGRVSISGLAWDHRRCWGPLAASVAPYGETTGVDIVWDRRSLFSFGEGELTDFISRYDLIVFDHPFVGEIADKGYLLNLDQFLSAGDAARFAADSVGKSWQSYGYRDGVWALPIDAAAQTAAWRPDLLERHGFDVPSTLEDVFTLAERARAVGQWVAWPASPTDLMCTLMSVSASLGLPTGTGEGAFLDPASATEIIAVLSRLAKSVHPMSQSWNPITCLDRMSDADDIAYIPYTFNYVNYATHPTRPIRFGTSPRVAPGQPVRAVLGGAGIGISATCANPRAAFDYANYLCSVEVQSSYYVREGGQPGSRTAWASQRCNDIANGFFGDTLTALDEAYLRPTHNGFVPLFRQATLKLRDVVHAGEPVEPFVSWLNAAYDRLLSTRVGMEEAG